MERLARHDLRHGDGRWLFVYGDHDGRQPPEDAPGGAWPALHLRHDALTDQWVAISPARNQRPQSRPSSSDAAPTCPLCPGGPELPFGYEAAVFENRFPTLLAAPPEAPSLAGETRASRGRCEVVLYTSTHEGSLATLTSRELARVIAIWVERSKELWEVPEHRYVLVFENRGEDVGATLSHPHGQIYALDHVPRLARVRVAALAEHRAATDTCLSCRTVDQDLGAADRTIAENPSFTIAVPFAPNWPYEVHVRARRHGARRLPDLTTAERADLARALRTVVRVYDRLYPEAPMAYMMVCQQAPAGDTGEPADDWHLSFEFLPPNRGPDKLKVRASVETAAGFFINDTVPEDSAAELAAALTAATGASDAPIPDVEVAPVTALAATDVD
jgi:UDPglucose--hexose-1-phosphate uridylyltransferase